MLIHTMAAFAGPMVRIRLPPATSQANVTVATDLEPLRRLNYIGVGGRAQTTRSSKLLSDRGLGRKHLYTGQFDYFDSP